MNTFKRIERNTATERLRNLFGVSIDVYDEFRPSGIGVLLESGELNLGRIMGEVFKQMKQKQNILIVGPCRGNIQIVDIENLKIVHQFEKTDSKQFTQITVMDSLLIIGMKQGSIKILNIEHNKDCLLDYNEVMQDEITAIKVHKKNTLIIGDRKGNLKQFDIEIGQVVENFPMIMQFAIGTFKLIGDRLIILDREGNIKIFDLVKHEVIISLEKFIPSWITLIKVTSKKIVVQYQRTHLKIFDLETLKIVKEVENFMNKDITAMRISEDGQLLVGDHKGNVKFFDLEKLEVVKEIQVQFNSWMNQMYVQSDIQIMGDKKGTVKIFDQNLGRCCKEFYNLENWRVTKNIDRNLNRMLYQDQLGHQKIFNMNRIINVELILKNQNEDNDIGSGEGKHENCQVQVYNSDLIVGDRKGNLRFFDFKNFKVLNEIKGLMANKITKMKIHDNHQWIADNFGNIKIFDQFDNTMIKEINNLMSCEITQMKFDNNRLIIADYRGNLKIFDMINYRVIKALDTFRHPKIKQQKICGDMLIVKSNQGQIKVFDMEKQATVKQINKFQNNEAKEVRQTKSHMYIAEKNGNLKVIDLVKNDLYKQYDKLFLSKVSKMKLLDNYLCIGDIYGNLTIFDTDTDSVLREFSNFMEFKITEIFVYHYKGDTHDRSFSYIACGDKAGNIKILQMHYWCTMQKVKCQLPGQIFKIKLRDDVLIATDISGNIAILDTCGFVLPVFYDYDKEGDVFNFCVPNDSPMQRTIEVPAFEEKIKYLYSMHSNLLKLDVRKVHNINFTLTYHQLTYSIYHFIYNQSWDAQRYFILLNFDDLCFELSGSCLISQMDTHVLIEAMYGTDLLHLIPNMLNVVFSNHHNFWRKDLNFWDIYKHIDDIGFMNGDKGKRIMEIFIEHMFTHLDYFKIGSEALIEEGVAISNFFLNKKDEFDDKEGFFLQKQIEDDSLLARVFPFLSGKIDNYEAEVDIYRCSFEMDVNFTNADKELNFQTNIGKLLKGDGETFSNPKLVKLIELFWRRNKALFKFYLAYLLIPVALTFYQNLSSNHEINIFLAKLVMLIAAPLVLIELYQQNRRGANYFRDLSNWFDMTALACLYISEMALITYPKDDPTFISIYVVSQFFIWAKLYQELRVIDRIRFLSQNLYLILFDIQPYLFIIFFFTLCFANLFFSAKFWSEREPNYSTLTPGSFYLYLLYTWDMLFGNYEAGTPHDFSLYWIMAVFIFVQILMSLIIVNNLIALVGKSFDDYISNKDAHDTEDKIQMIIDAIEMKVFLSNLGLNFEAELTSAYVIFEKGFLGNELQQIERDETQMKIDKNVLDGNQEIAGLKAVVENRAEINAELIRGICKEIKDDVAIQLEQNKKDILETKRDIESKIDTMFCQIRDLINQKKSLSDDEHKVVAVVNNNEQK